VFEVLVYESGARGNREKNVVRPARYESIRWISAFKKQDQIADDLENVKEGKKRR
jgi:hypothetical protein